MKHTNRIWGLDLSPALKLYLLALAERADASGECRTTRAALRRLTGYSDHVLSRLCSLAVASKLLQIVAKGRGERATQYRLTLPASEQGGAA